ncbi:hypothetical protein WJX84_000228 [Apatococcus fuscideae]|uniref:Uncharacterized protein n=1 Tax=Apatococcus fuscideae TaxID=2026836 RepID=A0AAW1RMF6_9CHLO
MKALPHEVFRAGSELLLYIATLLSPIAEVARVLGREASSFSTPSKTMSLALAVCQAQLTILLRQGSLEEAETLVMQMGKLQEAQAIDAFAQMLLHRPCQVLAVNLQPKSVQEKAVRQKLPGAWPASQSPGPKIARGFRAIQHKSMESTACSISPVILNLQNPKAWQEHVRMLQRTALHREFMNADRPSLEQHPPGQFHITWRFCLSPFVTLLATMRDAFEILTVPAFVQEPGGGGVAANLLHPTCSSMEASCHRGRNASLQAMFTSL